eukprot:3007572-Prymnesium_polylepis.1
MEGEYRSTFLRQDTKVQMYARMFDRTYASVEERDEVRAGALNLEGWFIEAAHGEVVRAWVAERGPAWMEARPAWLTQESGLTA